MNTRHSGWRGLVETAGRIITIVSAVLLAVMAPERAEAEPPSGTIAFDFTNGRSRYIVETLRPELLPSWDGFQPYWRVPDPRLRRTPTIPLDRLSVTVHATDAGDHDGRRATEVTLRLEPNGAEPRVAVVSTGSTLSFRSSLEDDLTVGFNDSAQTVDVPRDGSTVSSNRELAYAESFQWAVVERPWITGSVAVTDDPPFYEATVVSDDSTTFRWHLSQEPPPGEYVVRFWFEGSPLCQGTRNRCEFPLTVAPTDAPSEPHDVQFRLTDFPGTP